MAAPACPRCDTHKTERVADSPVKGKWEVYRCTECNYVWRSTEDLMGIDKRIDYLRKTAVHFWD
jgi:hypothetical protein